MAGTKVIVDCHRNANGLIGKPIESVTRSAWRVARQIGETLRQRTDKAKEAGKEYYRAWLDMTEEIIQQAAQMCEQLEQQSGKAAERLQSKRRVFKGESVPAFGWPLLDPQKTPVE